MLVFKMLKYESGNFEGLLLLLLSENVEGRANLGDLGVDGRILLRAVLTIRFEVVEWFK